VPPRCAFAWSLDVLAPLLPHAANATMRASSPAPRITPTRARRSHTPARCEVLGTSERKILISAPLGQLLFACGRSPGLTRSRACGTLHKVNDSPRLLDPCQERGHAAPSSANPGARSADSSDFNAAQDADDCGVRDLEAQTSSALLRSRVAPAS